MHKTTFTILWSRPNGVVFIRISIFEGSNSTCKIRSANAVHVLLSIRDSSHALSLNVIAWSSTVSRKSLPVVQNSIQQPTANWGICFFLVNNYDLSKKADMKPTKTFTNSNVSVYCHDLGYILSLYPSSVSTCDILNKMRWEFLFHLICHSNINMQNIIVLFPWFCDDHLPTDKALSPQEYTNLVYSCWRMNVYFK